MDVVTIAGRRYAQFPRLRAAPGLVHAFSTRPADVSPRADGREEERAARRRQMAGDLGLDPQRLTCCLQVHGLRIAVWDDAPRGGGLLEGFDGVVTAVADVPLMTFSADCPLVLAYDPRRRVLGLLHASWRCTVGQLGRRLVELLVTRYGTVPADLRVGIGPAAGPCCYEVQDDVWQAAAELPRRDEVFLHRNGRLYFDLWQANRQLLLEAGVRDANIELAGMCTMCRNDLFFSYRREGAGCGHFGLMAALVEPAGGQRGNQAAGSVGRGRPAPATEG